MKKSNKANIKEKKNKTILRMCRNLVFFIVLIILTYGLIFREQDMGELFRIVDSANDWYIILGATFMFMYYFIEAYNVRAILKLFGEKVSILGALKFTFIGFFFSAITPAASGGQPVEIYYMTKEKISGAKATMALLVQLGAFQICTILLAVISIIINPTVLPDGLIWLFLIGLLANSVILSTMMIAIFSQRLAKKLVNIAIKVLKALRIKNIDKKKERLEGGLSRYYESSKFIKEHKLEFMRAVLRVLLQVVFYYSIPFCVYKSFGLNDYNWFQIFTMQAVVFTTVNSMPLPGAIGVSESVFLGVFGAVFGTGLLNGAMLLNRGITFYLYVVICAIVVVFNAIKTKDIKGEIDGEKV